MVHFPKNHWISYVLNEASEVTGHVTLAKQMQCLFSMPCQIIIVMEGGGNGRIWHLWLQLTSFLKQTFFNVCETWMMGPGQSVCFRLTTWKMTWNSACTRLFAEMVHTGTASRYVCIPVKRPDGVHPNMFKPPFFCRGAKALLERHSGQDARQQCASARLPGQ